MKKFLLAALPLLSVAQPQTHWQQQVNYRMKIDFDVKNDQFSGTQTLLYENNSPDTIREVFYHLYYNAFQPNSMMDTRSRNIDDPDKRVGDRISKLKPDEIGYHRIGKLQQNGSEMEYEIRETVLHAYLPEPLPPNATTELYMEFESQVPVQIRRTGRHNSEGIDYTMTQWYPKLAAYDRNGWHPDPYVAREFYADFGSFDISINIDSDYRLGGTGVLSDEDEYWEEGDVRDSVVVMDYRKGNDKKRTWHFTADKVHDFAWAADEEYVRLKYTGNSEPELNFYFLDKYSKTWDQLPTHTAEFFRLMSKHFGEYVYPQFSVIQGGDGGMEYPMSTMLKGTGKLEGLVGVMAHESAHNWFYGMLATNENQYPWMDEGFTSFAEEQVLNMMSDEPVINPHLGAYNNYFYMVENGLDEPMSTPADYFTRNVSYGISSYSRGEIFLNQLRYILGEETFRKGMLEYYDRWSFKHPDPWDFITVMEDVSGLQLDWYLNFWTNTTKQIDYAVTDVKEADDESTEIALERIGEMPMPVELTVYLKSGEDVTYYIPNLSMMGHKQNEYVKPAPDMWPWTSPSYTLSVDIPYSEIESVRIDRFAFTADVDIDNNTFEIAE